MNKNYTVVAYAESTTFETLLVVFSDYNCAISPLHDKDVDKNGKIKKAHWHIVIFNANISVAVMKRINSDIGLSTEFRWQEVIDVDGILNYLTHEKDEGKYHYNQEDIWYSDTFEKPIGRERKNSDMFVVAKEFIDDNCITEISDLFDLLVSCDNHDLLDFIFKNESKFKHYIDSLRYKENCNTVRNRNDNNDDYISDTIEAGYIREIKSLQNRCKDYSDIIAKQDKQIKALKEKLDFYRATFKDCPFDDINER